MNDFRGMRLRGPVGQVGAEPRLDVLSASSALSLNHDAAPLEQADPSPNGGDLVAPSAAETDNPPLSKLTHTVLAEIYGAALGRRAWTAPILRLHQSIPFKCGLLGVLSDDKRSRADFHGIGVQPRFYDALPALLDDNDPFFAGRAVTTMVGQIQSGDTRLAPSGESAFINQWVRSQGLEHGICARIRLRVPAGDNLQLVVMVWRQARVRGFSRWQVDLVKSLLPHFRAGIRIQEVMKLPSSDWRSTARMLDRLPIGVVVLRHDGRPLKINSWAADLIARCDGLFVGKNGLEAILGPESLRLREAIERAFQPDADDAAFETVAITRGEGVPLQLFVHVLNLPSANDKTEQPLAFAFIAESEMSTQEHGLLNDYGLTVAEARIALSIAAGHRLDTVAQQLGVSLSTARTHLQRVFSKTGTQRQVELVRLLLMSRRGWVE